MDRIFVFILSIVFCVAARPAPGQNPSDMVYLPEGSFGTGTGTSWNPYPGLGIDGIAGESCVTPGQRYTDYTNSTDFSTGPSTTIPTTTLLPSDFEEEFGNPMAPARWWGELYLSQMPTGKREGVFQKANFNALWAPKRGGDNGLGMTQLDVSAMFAVPMLKPESPLVVTPLFSAWLFDPKSADKFEMYTTGVDIRWIRPIVKNKLTLDIGGSVLYSGNFHGKAKKMLRYPAHGAAIWNFNPRLKIVLGVVYLDRNDDYNWLPMAGLIWTPHDDLSVELLAPRLRIAQRIRWFGSVAGNERSDWIYGAFEFGGGSWTYQEGDERSTLDYRDLRLLLGYERRTAFGMTIGFEVGYMFQRKFEDGVFGKIDMADNVFLRLRTSF